MSRKTKTSDGPDMRRGAFLCLGIFLQRCAHRRVKDCAAHPLIYYIYEKGELYAVLFSTT